MRGSEDEDLLLSDSISDDTDIEWIILNQFGRRNLLPFQRSELALRLKPIIRAKAKENQTSGINQYSLPQKSATPSIETRNELAKMAGVSVIYAIEHA